MARILSGHSFFDGFGNGSPLNYAVHMDYAADDPICILLFELASKGSMKQPCYDDPWSWLLALDLRPSCQDTMTVSLHFDTFPWNFMSPVVELLLKFKTDEQSVIAVDDFSDSEKRRVLGQTADCRE